MCRCCCVHIVAASSSNILTPKSMAIIAASAAMNGALAVTLPGGNCDIVRHLSSESQYETLKVFFPPLAADGKMSTRPDPLGFFQVRWELFEHRTEEMLKEEASSWTTCATCEARHPKRGANQGATAISQI